MILTIVMFKLFLRLQKLYHFFSIHSCQDVLLDNMKLEKNIARNSALCENVFMMLVCTSLRIPLFLVGKPGSSKSLAKSIILNSMKGPRSEMELLQKLKEVWMTLRTFTRLYPITLIGSTFSIPVLSTFNF